MEAHGLFLPLIAFCLSVYRSRAWRHLPRSVGLQQEAEVVAHSKLAGYFAVAKDPALRLAEERARRSGPEAEDAAEVPPRND